jgi:hypothetical protein
MEHRELQHVRRAAEVSDVAEDMLDGQRPCVSPWPGRTCWQMCTIGSTFGPPEASSSERIQVPEPDSDDGGGRPASTAGISHTGKNHRTAMGLLYVSRPE